MADLPDSGVVSRTIKELFSIIGIFIGLIAAAWIYAPLESAVPGAIGPEHLSRAFTFILIFISVFLILCCPQKISICVVFQ